MVDKIALSHVELDQSAVALLKKIAADLPILADICRADLALVCRAGPKQVMAVVQVTPHSFTPVYEESRVGLLVSSSNEAEIWRALMGKADARQVHTVDVRGTSVARRLFPVYNPNSKIIAVMVMDSYWFAHERHRRRSKVFQDALIEFIGTVLRGELHGAENLTPFGEHDGIVYVGPDRRIQYISGIASELYRQLGYRDSLVGRRVTDLETIDFQLVAQAANERRCLERQVEQHGLTWTRRVLPITSPERPGRLARLLGAHALHRGPLFPRGVFILIHDETEALHTQRELEAKMALVREVHHRVKNNLQVIASILRMQARRTKTDEAKAVLEESVNRILSVAVVHEFLSQNAQGSINLQEVARRILGQIQDGLIDPNKRIRLQIKGPDVWLPAERATQCALVINELVQNAIEHGMADRTEGQIEVELVDHGEAVTIMITDDGQGLPQGFDLSAHANLGLNIVRSMVERDLRGQFELLSSPYGARANIHFDKLLTGGDKVGTRTRDYR